MVFPHKNHNFRGPFGASSGCLVCLFTCEDASRLLKNSRANERCALMKLLWALNFVSNVLLGTSVVCCFVFCVCFFV